MSVLRGVITARQLVAWGTGRILVESSCNPDAEGQSLEMRMRVTYDQGVLFEHSCEKPPGEDWDCNDAKELLGLLHGDLVTDTRHENDMWFEPCLHVEHGYQELVVSGTTIRGFGLESAHWIADNPDECNDLSGENLPCTERVDADLVRCEDCWPPAP